jgi:hypothetical protein
MSVDPPTKCRRLGRSCDSKERAQHEDSVAWDSWTIFVGSSCGAKAQGACRDFRPAHLRFGLAAGKMSDLLYPLYSGITT